MRVRIHKDIARIEVMPEIIERIAQKENREKISKAFKEYGFSYVTLDLEGYRTGSMNNFKWYHAPLVIIVQKFVLWI